ncbi:hypothetical protein ACH5RR_038335 [Cinchona calisaya]|uniref:WRKY domain-containing protein n=1 Tax=Cinchona calisaya TaxID=153742 RepID=A0ABD2XUZ8_9GENT
MEVSEDEVMKPDHTDKATSLNRASFSLSSDTYLLEKARKLLRGNNRESSPSCSINSPTWNTQIALTVQSKLSLENGPEGQSQATVSVNGSPHIEDANENIKDFVEHVSKKRRREPVCTPQARVSPENELEVPPDDGYIWTKDGQNEILGAKFPRSYYRCKYKCSYMLNCSAEKIVQRSDDDPTRFVNTYIGTDTCNQNMTRLSPGSNIFNFNFFPSSSNASETQYNNANNSSNISSSLLLTNLFDYGNHHESGSSNKGFNLSDNVIPEYLSSSIPSLYTFSVQNHTISSDSTAIVSLQEAGRLGSKTSNASPSLYSSSVQNHIISPVFSATALLQEASRLDSKMSNAIPSPFKSWCKTTLRAQFSQQLHCFKRLIGWTLKQVTPTLHSTAPQ